MQLGQRHKGRDIRRDFFIAEKILKEGTHRAHLAHDAQLVVIDHHFSVGFLVLLDIHGQVILIIPQLTGRDGADLLYGDQAGIDACKGSLLQGQILEKEAQIIGISQAGEGTGGLGDGKKIIGAGIRQFLADFPDALGALHLYLPVIIIGFGHSASNSSFNYSQKYFISFFRRRQPILLGEKLSR